MTPYQLSLVDIIGSNARRGRALAQELSGAEYPSNMIARILDLFQHILDEQERLRKSE